MKTELILFALTIATPALTSADVIIWTNTNNGNWNAAANWSPNQVPATNDIAIITNAGSYTVTLNTYVTISGLVLGGNSGTQTLSTAEQVLTLDGSGNVGARGVFKLSLGSLSGSSQLRVAGAFAWDGGVIDTNAAVSVVSGGQMLIGPGANHARVLHGAITNAGTITWRSSGWIFVAGVLHNLDSGLFDAQWAAPIVGLPGTPRFVNDGVFRKSGGAGTLDCSVPFINNGTVDTQVGKLTLPDGSVFNAGGLFIGAGETVLNNGTNTINGDIHCENLSLQYSATLVGTGSFSGTLAWGGGYIGPGAALTVATNGELRLGGGTYVKFLYGNLTNAGTIIYQPAGSLAIGGALHNLGLFDAQINGRLFRLGSSAVFINDGTFQRSLVAGSTACELPFVNRGTIKVPLGTLNFEGSYSNPIGTIEVCGGTFRTLQPLDFSGGLLTGWGTVSADVTNAACIRPACSNGLLTITGRFEQLLGGRLEFDLAGNTPGIDQSRLNITGAATLRGTIGVRWGEGYLPSPGTNFSVVSFASRQGEFCCFDNFILLGQERRLTPVYSATTLTLATIAALEPTTVPLRVTVDGDALVCWPVEFPGYELYWSTNLSQTNWTRLPGTTNRWIESAPLAREKFFRLKAP